MAAQVHSFLLLLVSIIANPSAEIPPAQEDGESSYGNAEISRVAEITSDFTLICDIRNYPPVIGHKMPVRIRGLESAQPIPDPGLRESLDTLLRADRNDPNHIVLLKNIQRGERFCLIADIEVDGRDLGDHLVQQGLVKRILKVPSAEGQTDNLPGVLVPSHSSALQPAAPVSKPAAPNPPQARGYVASKSSRIFHRADCPHAKRIVEEKKVYFSSREQAAAGRRPCKACNP